MNARSEGDETPLWLDAHACQEARSGGTGQQGPLAWPRSFA